MLYYKVLSVCNNKLLSTGGVYIQRSAYNTNARARLIYYLYIFSYYGRDFLAPIFFAVSVKKKKKFNNDTRTGRIIITIILLLFTKLRSFGARTRCRGTKSDRCVGIPAHLQTLRWWCFGKPVTVIFIYRYIYII